MTSAQQAALIARRAKNATRRQVNNMDLDAGSPMYYYCRCCGEERVLPEHHNMHYMKLRYCDECLKLSPEEREQ